MLKKNTIKPLFMVVLLLSGLLFYACAHNTQQPEMAGSACTISYDSLKVEVQQAQQAFNKQYLTANSQAKDSLIKKARAYLLKTIVNDYFAQWYNTPWNFYGNTRTPQQGTIACGYFVTTVLQDAGFNIPRTAWAQLASETMMKKMNPDLKRFSNTPMPEFEKQFEGKPDGLYIVGLDMHVGFIYKLNGQLQFVHSSYYQPSIGVMSQDLEGHNPLNDSKYRVVGEILHKEMVVNWITGKKYE
jgi:hypothetical protein